MRYIQRWMTDVIYGVLDERWDMYSNMSEGCNLLSEECQMEYIKRCLKDEIYSAVSESSSIYKTKDEKWDIYCEE